MGITVFVVDDHTLVRNAIAQVIDLEDDLQVVGQGTSSSETLETIRRLQPHVVVVDLEMPVIRGPNFIAMIKDSNAGIRALVCSMHSAHGYVAEALRRGSDGYVLKSSPSALLLEAIRTVAAGKAFIDPAVQSDVLRMVQTGGGAESKDLTAGELEVLRLVADGLSNEEIARRIQQSLETVKQRMRRAFHKLGASDRTHAVALALRQNLIM